MPIAVPRSCAVGSQSFSWQKLAVLTVVIAGCTTPLGSGGSNWIWELGLGDLGDWSRSLRTNLGLVRYHIDPKAMNNSEQYSKKVTL